MALPLYEQLYNYVFDAIRSGKLQSGDRVPSEADLAKQFNVSRITSKKALELLEQAGLIERIRGKGSFVRVDSAFANPLQHRHEQDVQAAGQRLIGVIVPDFSDAYALKMIHAIEETCADHAIFIAVKRTYDSQAVEKAAIQGLVALGASGLIVFPVHGDYYNPELLRLVVGGFPIVLIDRHLKGIPASAVYTDSRRASRELTLHLLDKGYRQVAFISPPPENTSTIEERIDGYRAALAERGIPFNSDYLLTTLYSTLPITTNQAHIAHDIQTLQDYLARFPQIEAFVASEYNLALLLSKVLSPLGLSQPIVCFDSPYSSLPPLFTHIKQDETLMGQQAVAVLMQHIAGQAETQTVITDFEFVEVEQDVSHPILIQHG